MWWGQLHADPWRFVIVLLYNVANDLGRQLTDAAVYSLMAGSITSTEVIREYFGAETVPNATLTSMFTDQLYGLNNTDHYARWGALNAANADTNQRLIFEMELQSYFGLSAAQILAFKKEW